MRLCRAHGANWREVWGSWVGAGGLGPPTSQSQDVPCQGPPSRVEEATKLQNQCIFYIQNLLFDAFPNWGFWKQYKSSLAQRKVFAKLCLSEPSTSGGYKLSDIFEIFKGSFLISFLRTSKQPKLTRLSYEENQINSSNGCEDENASPGRRTGLWEGTKSSSEVSDLKPKPPC